MFKVAFASAALLALLAACSPVDAELDGDLEVNGMDPAFWGVKVVRAQNTTTWRIAFPSRSRSKP